jgi:hypothetical protein
MISIAQIAYLPRDLQKYWRPCPGDSPSPGTENQMDPSIDLAPLQSIDFDLEVSNFNIRFGPNNWSHPLKSIVKANNLLPESL